MNKNEKYMELAKQIGSMFSHDKSTKVGCVIVGETGEILSSGYNGFVRNSDNEREDWHQRPLKYDVTVHAECNAIYNAARTGTKIMGSSMYVSSLCPCNNCSLAIVQAGISKLYLTEWAFSPNNQRGQAWIDKWPLSKEILGIGNVEIYIIEDQQNSTTNPL